MDTTAWQGPPTDVLGCAVPIQQFLARTEYAVVALHHAVAVPEGCTLTLHLSVRRGQMNESAWAHVTDTDLGADPGPSAGDWRLGVRLPGGAKATTVEHPFPGWATGSDKPENPLLVESGADSASNNREYRRQQQLWLWPLPPPAPFEFIFEWPGMSIDPTVTILDGAAIVRAATLALPYWPDAT